MTKELLPIARWPHALPGIVFHSLLLLSWIPASAEVIGTRVQLGHFSIPGLPNDYTPPFQHGSHSRIYPGGSTSATAGTGTLSIEARYSSPANQFGTAYLKLNSYFADTVTIDAPGRTGQPGAFTVSYIFDGSYDANGYWNNTVSVYSAFVVDDGVGDGTIPSMGSTAGHNTFTYRGDDTYGFGDFSSLFPGEEQTKTGTFIFGQPFDFWLKLGAQLQTYKDIPGDTRIAMALVKWSGIKNITAGGTPVANATVSGISGSNWTQAVASSLPAATNQTRIAEFVLTPTSLILRGTNGAAHGPYQILSSSDISLPPEAWPIIYANRYDASGGFDATNQISPTNAQRFFRVQ